jgi:hypothetical protein
VKVDVYKETRDDWYGSFEVTGEVPALAVRVSFCGQLDNGKWRTCVWGTDDCGMEQDFDTEAGAWTAFVQVIGLDYVDMKGLVELGFYSA